MRKMMVVEIAIYKSQMETYFSKSALIKYVLHVYVLDNGSFRTVTVGVIKSHTNHVLSHSKCKNKVNTCDLKK